jgi:hypothetical protein
VFTAFGPLAETLPAGVGLASWRVADYRARLAALLSDPLESAACVAAIQSGDSTLNWEAAAEALSACFRAALSAPPRDDRVVEEPDQSLGAVLSSLQLAPGSDAHAALMAVTASLSWRVTAPLRRATATARRQKRRLEAARRASK